MSKIKPDKQIIKNVVIAVEPALEISASFDLFSRTLKMFQDHDLLPSASIVSIIHPALFMVPNSWYYKNENRYANEAKLIVEGTCSGQFAYRNIHVLKANASSNQFLVEEVSKYLKRIRSSLLIVLSNNKTGLSHWILGSFAETATLISTTPILVIKPQSIDVKFSTKPKLVVAVDASATYSSKHVKWISDLCLPSGSSIDLVYVEPKPHGILFALRKPKLQNVADGELKKMEEALKELGLAATLIKVKERGSVAQTLVDYADKRNAWSILTISSQRKLARRLLIGSTARRVLSLTKLPYFNLILT